VAFEIGMLVETEEIADAAAVAADALRIAIHAAATPGLRVLELRTAVSDAVVAVA